jgi:hypothetical protein
VSDINSVSKIHFVSVIGSRHIFLSLAALGQLLTNSPLL